ncbi:MAG TPA: helix-turn-helix domain-containing protein [Gemmatimonadales bacterium]
MRSPRPVTWFETRHQAGTRLEVHRHREAYVALVVDGAYHEASADGLWWCEPGTLVIHPPLHAHANAFPLRGVRVLNARLDGGHRTVRRYGAWTTALSATPSHWRSASADDLLAAVAGATPLEPIAGPPFVQALARELRSCDSTRVAGAARRAHVSREHAARTFRRHFGMPPRSFRAEHRLRFAIDLLGTTALPLSCVAHDAGFADQAHFTRTVKTALGLTPGALRRWWKDNQTG